MFYVANDQKMFSMVDLNILDTLWFKLYCSTGIQPRGDLIQGIVAAGSQT